MTGRCKLQIGEVAKGAQAPGGNEQSVGILNRLGFSVRLKVQSVRYRGELFGRDAATPPPSWVLALAWVSVQVCPRSQNSVPLSN